MTYALTLLANTNNIPMLIGDMLKESTPHRIQGRNITRFIYSTTKLGNITKTLQNSLNLSYRA